MYGILKDPFGDELVMIWLPKPDFYESVSCLTTYQVGRQVHEAWWILECLTGRRQRANRYMMSRLWNGYSSGLALYLSLAIREWNVRGFPSCHEAPYDFRNNYKLNEKWIGRLNVVNKIHYPPWVGNERLHSSHRSFLLRDEPVHYSQFGWIDNVPELYWPEGCTNDVDRNPLKREIRSSEQRDSEIYSRESTGADQDLCSRGRAKKIQQRALESSVRKDQGDLFNVP